MKCEPQGGAQGVSRASVCVPGKRMELILRMGLSGQHVLLLMSPLIPWDLADGKQLQPWAGDGHQGRLSKPFSSSLWYLLPFKFPVYFILTWDTLLLLSVLL